MKFSMTGQNYNYTPYTSYGGGHLSEMTTQKSGKKVDIWAKEKQPKRAKSKKPDGHWQRKCGLLRQVIS
jgi:hypothetical protein